MHVVAGTMPSAIDNLYNDVILSAKKSKSSSVTRHDNSPMLRTPRRMSPPTVAVESTPQLYFPIVCPPIVCPPIVCPPTVCPPTVTTSPSQPVEHNGLNHPMELPQQRPLSSFVTVVALNRAKLGAAQVTLEALPLRSEVDQLELSLIEHQHEIKGLLSALNKEDARKRTVLEQLTQERRLRVRLEEDQAKLLKELNDHHKERDFLLYMIHQRFNNLGSRSNNNANGYDFPAPPGVQNHCEDIMPSNNQAVGSRKISSGCDAPIFSAPSKEKDTGSTPPDIIIEAESYRSLQLGFVSTMQELRALEITAAALRKEKEKWVDICSSILEIAIPLLEKHAAIV